jgi:choline dehydrogenase-like flavoprotein
VDLHPDGTRVERYVGERCVCNTACTPICPIQARYNAGKSLGRAIIGGLQVLSQAVASKRIIDPIDGTVTGIEYRRYHDPGLPTSTPHVARGQIYILAVHAVENAKLLLASGCGGVVGQGLMDHPALYVWGLGASAHQHFGRAEQLLHLDQIAIAQYGLQRRDASIGAQNEDAVVAGFVGEFAGIDLKYLAVAGAAEIASIGP